MDRTKGIRHLLIVIGGLLEEGDLGPLGDQDKRIISQLAERAGIILPKVSDQPFPSLGSGLDIKSAQSQYVSFRDVSPDRKGFQVLLPVGVPVRKTRVVVWGGYKVEITQAQTPDSLAYAEIQGYINGDFTTESGLIRASHLCVVAVLLWVKGYDKRRVQAEMPGAPLQKMFDRSALGEMQAILQSDEIDVLEI